MNTDIFFLIFLHSGFWEPNWRSWESGDEDLHHQRLHSIWAGHWGPAEVGCSEGLNSVDGPHLCHQSELPTRAEIHLGSISEGVPGTDWSEKQPKNHTSKAIAFRRPVWTSSSKIRHGHLICAVMDLLFQLFFLNYTVKCHPAPSWDGCCSCHSSLWSWMSCLELCKIRKCWD